MFTRIEKQQVLDMIKNARKTLDDYQPPHWMQQIEARYCLFFLEQLVAENKSNVRQLLDHFFSVRWSVIKESNTHYFNDLLNPANQVCVALVKLAGFYKDMPFLSILIPPLASVPLAQYVSSPYDDRSLGLQELILSDCGCRLINCQEALAFACQDAKLKHNSLGFNNAVIPLTDKEKARLLSRHPSFQRAYDAVCGEFSYRHFGDTVGAQLTRLAEGLKDGTPRANKGGQEMDAGSPACEAISEFSLYMERMDKDVKKRLMGTFIPDRFRVEKEETFNEVWDLLARGFSDDNPNEWERTIYCVDMIATKIKNLLDKNSWLFDQSPYKDHMPEVMQSLADEVKRSMQAVENSLPLIVGQPSCEKGHLSLCEKFLPFLLQDLGQFRLTSRDIKCLMECYTGKNRQLSSLAKPILAQLALQRSPDLEHRLELLLPEERKAFDRLAPHVINVSSATIFKSTRKRVRGDQDAGESVHSSKRSKK